jgi:tRNA A37 threonylcarbamoyladenosine biosynthesis protein TsaE
MILINFKKYNYICKQDNQKLHLMKYKLEKLEIPVENPFENCKLDREKYAEILKAIITEYENGLVLAINGKWGTGKTTFVEMWKAYLELDNFHTLYFNAWEYDFISDPLIGLLGELKKIDIYKKAEDSLMSVINTACKIALKAAPSMAKGVIKRYVGEDVVDILGASMEEAAEILKKEIENYEKQKNSLAQFRERLGKYVDEVCDKKPLVFIIDELDRCNPYYAVKVLERIKHLFNIPNVIFVLSIDKRQLCNSIRGYYGSNLIDADEYLKRFIDIEYVLPDPDIERYCKYLFDYYGFNSFFYQLKSTYHRTDDLESLFIIATSIFKFKKTTLRQIEKIFTNVYLALVMFDDKHNICADLLCLLTYFRICEYDFYEKIVSKQYTVQELVIQIEKIIPRQIFDLGILEYRNNNRFFYCTIAYLLKSYITTYIGDDKENLLSVQGEEKILTFKVKIMHEKQMIETIEWTENNLRILPLDAITKNINLLSNFQSDIK